MSKMTLSDCIALATFAHRNQFDKAGEPYIKHPVRVMETVQAMGGQPYVQMAAVLHDSTEDSNFTPQMLLDLGVPEAAVEIVKLVDRDYSEKLFSQFAISRGAWTQDKNEYYYSMIKKNPGAVQVKMADIGDNLQPWRLVYLPPETQTRLRAKYAKALKLLGA